MKSVKLIAAGLASAAAFTTLAPSTASAAPTARVFSGYTLVELSSTFVGAITSLNVTPAAILPANLVPGLAYFPITGGRLDAANAKGEVPHSGGLSLTAGSTKVELTDFIIDTTGTQFKLTGLVTANGSVSTRIPLFNLALRPGVTLPLAPKAGTDLIVIGANVTLTAEAATALNGAFGVTAFTAGIPIGVAAVNAMTIVP